MHLQGSVANCMIGVRVRVRVSLQGSVANCMLGRLHPGSTEGQQGLEGIKRGEPRRRGRPRGGGRVGAGSRVGQTRGPHPCSRGLG